MLTKKDYAEALFSQSASNLSGIVHAFSRVISKIHEEVGSQGTDAVNKHPICRLYAEQIIYLSGGGMSTNSETYWNANLICEENSK